MLVLFRGNGSLDEWLSQRSAKPCTAVRIRQEPPIESIFGSSYFFNFLVPWMSGLVSGLQNRVRRFESARNLETFLLSNDSENVFFMSFFVFLSHFAYVCSMCFSQTRAWMSSCGRVKGEIKPLNLLFLCLF